MKVWLVLQIKNEKIGTKNVNTKEYDEYLNRKAESDRESEEFGGWVFGNNLKEPEIKRKTIPYMFNIPRIIEVSFQDPTEKYKDRLPIGENWVYKRDLVWIEELEMEDEQVTEHFKYNFN